MEIVISAFCVGNILINWISLRRISMLVILIQLWWFGWLLLSRFSLTGLYPASRATVCLVLILLSCITMGSCAYAFLSSRLKAVPKFLITGPDEKSTARMETLAIRILLATALPFVIFFFLRAVFLIPAEPDVATYRAKVFGIGLGYSLLFRYPAIEAINQFIVDPLILSGLFLGVSAYVQYNRPTLFIISAFLLMMHALMMMGRFGFHYVFMMSLLVFCFKAVSSAPLRFHILRRLALLLAAIVISTVIITLSRTPPSGKGIQKVLTTFIVDYHTVAFSIFDSHYHDPRSLLHVRSYGRSALGPFERLATRGLRALGVDKASQVEMNGLALNDGKEVGQDSVGNKIHYNAFGSVLFSLYRDGGVVFIVVAGLFFGFLVARFSESLRHRNSAGMAILAALGFIGIYGIFQPVIEGPIYLAILFLILLRKSAPLRTSGVTT